MAEAKAQGAVCPRLRGTLDLSDYNLLRHMLDTLPKKRFAELPASRVDPLAVCDAARQWHEEGEDERAAALLEPWFAGEGALAGKLEPLFDQLMDCCLALGRERKRERLVTAVLARGDRDLRVAALERRSTMRADRGDIDGAWASFREAQREAGVALEPRDALARTESRWRKVFAQAKPGLTATQHGDTGMWHEPRPWLEFLERNAAAWQSLESARRSGDGGGSVAGHRRGGDDRRAAARTRGCAHRSQPRRRGRGKWHAAMGLA